MQMREIGRSGIQVAPLAFGGNVFGWTLDEKASFAMLDAFVDAGFNLVDSADMYSSWVPGHVGGESETVLGNWIARSGKRGRIVLATKCGKSMGEGRSGLSARYIEQAVEASLKRLQTDYIDLYQAHAPDPATPIEETMEAFDRLVRAGKVRALGASNYSADELSQALGASRKHHLMRFESLQPLYNLYDRADYEGGLAELCAQEGLAVLPFFALASGFLTGKYRKPEDLEGQARAGMVASKMTDRGVAILQALDQVSERLGLSPATVAIAWLLQRPTVTAPIASATKPEHFEALVKATQVELDAEAISLLDLASA